MIEMVKYLMCVAGGVAIGYYIAHGRLEQDFHERLERETDEARDFYRRKYMKKAKEEGEDQGLTEAAIKTAEALRQTYEGGSVGPSVLTQEMSAVVQRAVERGELDVFPEGEEPTSTYPDIPEQPDEKAVDKTVNPPAEEAPAVVEESSVPRVRNLASPKPPMVNYNRISTPPKVETPKAPETPAVADKDEPKIEVDAITKQAFIGNEFGYEQFSLTYYAADDVLANEVDEPMTGNRVHMLGREASEKIKVGRQAMEGSDTIYVRNHTGKWEFEVTRSEGSFSDEVAAESG